MKLFRLCFDRRCLSIHPNTMEGLGADGNVGFVIIHGHPVRKASLRAQSRNDKMSPHLFRGTQQL